MKLRPEVKAEWTRRLRSGEYPQGHTYLKNDMGYCCLGVLCDMAEEEGVVRSEMQGRRRVHMYYGTSPETNKDGSAIWTPADVINWAFGEEIVNDGGNFQWSVEGPDDDQYVEEHHENLAGLNDAQVPFAAIANVIDAKY